MFGRILGEQECAGDCTDGAGMRPRCDLLRKDSGKGVRSYSSPEGARGSALPVACGGLTSMWSMCD